MSPLDMLNDLKYYISNQRKSLGLVNNGLTVCLVEKAVRKWNTTHDSSERIALPKVFGHLVDGMYLIDERAKANAELYINDNVIYYPANVKRHIIKSYIKSWEQRVPLARLHQLYITDGDRTPICKYPNEQLAKDLNTVIGNINHLMKAIPKDKPNTPVQTSLF